MSILDLENQLLFYGAYHHHPANVWIHIICVPLILLSTFLLLTNTGPLLGAAYTNLGVIVSVVYGALYVLMEPIAGGMLFPLLVGSTIYSTNLVSEYGSLANKYAGAANVVSWIMQFVGHGLAEGRAPALLDNLVQALFLAPFFVWFEILFMLGYRPALKARLDTAIEKEIASVKARENKRKQQTQTKNGKAQ